MLTLVLVQVVFPQYHTTWIVISVYFVLNYAFLCEISSMVDGLTGLLNKTVFSKHMLYLQEKPSRGLYLLMIDINNFKKINDKNGHLYGDKCLKEIAEIFIELFERDAEIYRFGGDEFCVVLRTNSQECVERYISQLHDRIEEKRKYIVDLPNVAVGYDKFSSNVNVRDTIDQADANMYEDKKRIKKIEGEVDMLY